VSPWFRIHFKTSSFWILHQLCCPKTCLWLFSIFVHVCLSQRQYNKWSWLLKGHKGCSFWNNDLNPLRRVKLSSSFISYWHGLMFFSAFSKILNISNSTFFNQINCVCPHQWINLLKILGKPWFNTTDCVCELLSYSNSHTINLT